LPVAHIDDITIPIAICNDTYKFAAYLYSILQEFAVDSKVMVMSHPEAVGKLHVWRAYIDRFLKRSAFIAYELNTPCDPDISFVFNKDDEPPFIIGALIELPSFTDLSQRPALPPPPWSRCDALVLTL